MIPKPKLILHICCAICGGYLIELLKEKFQITLYYYNPNIWPKEEYEKRLIMVKKLAEIYQIELKEGKYENDLWLENILGLEKEPEGGKRCQVCFKMRLQKTAQLSQESDAPYFSTTLAISPFKNEELINQLGEQIARANNLIFLSLKEIGVKKELWAKTFELAKKYHFYRQKYCGCQFSLSTLAKK